MSNRRVLVVYKESAYSRFLSSRQLTKSLGQNRYWEVVKGSHGRHNATLGMVEEVLAQEGVRVDWILRSAVSRLRNVDEKYKLVISVGGDGTLLDASHLLARTPILGVNSDTVRSVGRFSGCHIGTFQETFKRCLRGKIKPVLVPRLEFEVDGKSAPWPVLNDLLVTTASPAGTSRYILKSGPRIEEQMSSGVWISTAAGSTAAILSAGGKALPVLAPKFQFVVREAYQKKFGPRRLLKGVLGRGQSLEVTSYMKEGKVFVDGANLFLPFGLGQKLRVRLSKKPLKIIGLR